MYKAHSLQFFFKIEVILFLHGVDNSLTLVVSNWSADGKRLCISPILAPVRLFFPAHAAQSSLVRSDEVVTAARWHIKAAWSLPTLPELRMN